MKTKLIILGMIFACLILQCSLMPAIAIASVTPNLMIVFVVSFGLMRGKRSGLLIGLICGLLTDMMFMVLGNYIIGFRGIIYMYIGFFSGYCYRIFYDDDVKMPVILAAASDLVYGILMYGVTFLLRGRVNFFYYLGRVIMPEVVYTIVLTLICYWLFLYINRRIEKSDKRSVDSFV